MHAEPSLDHTDHLLLPVLTSYLSFHSAPLAVSDTGSVSGRGFFNFLFSLTNVFDANLVFLCTNLHWGVSFNLMTF